MGKFYSVQERDLIIKMWNENCSAADIADKVGRNEMNIRTIIVKWRKMYGEEVVHKHSAGRRTKPRRVWTNRDDNCLISMYQDGRTYSQIAYVTDRTIDAVIRRVRRLRNVLGEEVLPIRTEG